MNNKNLSAGRPAQRAPGEPATTDVVQAAQMKQLLDLLPNPACHLDARGNILHLNDTWRALAGSRIQAGMSWLDLLDVPEERAAAAKLLRDLQPGRAQQIECRLRDATGGSRWYLLNLQQCPAPAEGCLCVATDIHAQHLREQELLLRANLRTSMLDGSADCIKLIGLDGHLIHMNKAGCEALGVTPGQFGMQWAPLLAAEVQPLAEHALDEARQGRSARFLGISALPGQAPRSWDNMLAPLRDASGRTTAILCVSRDVTEELQTLDNLRQSRETLAIAARVGGLGIWDYDLKADALRCDEGWYRIMGRDPADPVNSIAEFRPLIHPEDVDRATEVELTARELAQERRNYGIVFRIVRPNGEIRWIRSTACLLQDEVGMSQRAVGFVVDVTDSWRGELALRDANRALEERNESLARQSLEDALTGLANRRFLDSELARICMQAAQKPMPVAVAMIDVDYFKAYNDQYGHAPDRLLRLCDAALYEAKSLGRNRYVVRSAPPTERI